MSETLGEFPLEYIVASNVIYSYIYIYIYIYIAIGNDNLIIF